MRPCFWRSARTLKGSAMEASRGRSTVPTRRLTTSRASTREVAEVVVDGGDEVVFAEGVGPALVGRALCADFGDEDEVAGVRVERVADELVDDVRAVEVAGVDVVDAGFDGGAQDSFGLFGVLGRPPDHGTGELHGAKAEAVHDAVAEFVGACEFFVRWCHLVRSVLVAYKQMRCAGVSGASNLWRL